MALEDSMLTIIPLMSIVIVFLNVKPDTSSRADPGFQVRGGGVLKEMALSGGRREHYLLYQEEFFRTGVVLNQ
jgi:hypothetical protein